MLIRIDKKEIGDDKKVFIIAELSANHQQKFDIAVKTIEAAKKAGADAIKLQTYTPDTMTINCDNDYFRIKQGTLWDGALLYDLYKTTYTPWEWQPKLKKIANKLGMPLFSTPFDKTSVDFLVKANMPILKVASPEITDIPLIEYIASKNKPMIISTGMATLSDIEDAIQACKRMHNDQIILLKCTSEYPTPMEEVNLKIIPHLHETFNCIVGLSDHTLGISVPVAAVALGAKVIEKHFILDKKLGGPDSAFSIDPTELKQMIKSVRDTEKALGSVNYDLTMKMKKNREFSRSLFVVEDIAKGDLFTEKNIRSIRPGYGLHPRFYREIIGKKATKNLKKGTPLGWNLLF